MSSRSVVVLLLIFAACSKQPPTTPQPKTDADPKDFSDRQALLPNSDEAKVKKLYESAYGGPKEERKEHMSKVFRQCLELYSHTRFMKDRVAPSAKNRIEILNDVLAGDGIESRRAAHLERLKNLGRKERIALKQAIVGDGELSKRKEKATMMLQALGRSPLYFSLPNADEVRRLGGLALPDLGYVHRESSDPDLRRKAKQLMEEIGKRDRSIVDLASADAAVRTRALETLKHEGAWGINDLEMEVLVPRNPQTLTASLAALADLKDISSDAARTLALLNQMYVSLEFKNISPTEFIALFERETGIPGIVDPGVPEGTKLSIQISTARASTAIHLVLAPSGLSYVVEWEGKIRVKKPQ